MNREKIQMTNEAISGYNSKRHTHPYVHNSIIHNSQNMETTEMSVDRGMDKCDVVHIYDGILLDHKKERKHAICSNTDATIDYYAK